jgi:hypothetical protein
MTCPMLRTDGFTSCRRAPCSPEAGWTNRHRRVLCGWSNLADTVQDALITVAVTSVLAGRDGLRDPVVGVEADAGMQVDSPLTMTTERWRSSDAGSGGRVYVPKESLLLEIKRAFPFGIDGRR